MNSLTGRILKKQYRVDNPIGRGGMADVYRAHDLARDIPVALKFLRDDLSEDRAFRDRFQREAEILSKLQHPNIVRMYGLEMTGHLSFIVMELIEGQVLRREVVERVSPFSLQETLSILEPVCRALLFSHRKGVYHCDVKPANIFISNDGRIVLSDFGISRLAESATVTFSTPGTPAYMSPEQIRGETLDARTDIYALGITLFELMTLERVFDGEEGTGSTSGSRGERIRWEHLNKQPRSPSEVNPDIDPNTEQVILKALSKKPEERFQSVDEFTKALTRDGQEKPIPVTQWSVATANQDSNHIRSEQIYHLESLYKELQQVFQSRGGINEAKRGVELCSEILSIDPTYKDVADILVEAKARLAHIKSKADDQYRRGRHDIVRGMQKIQASRSINPEQPDEDNLFALLESHTQLILALRGGNFFSFSWKSYSDDSSAPNTKRIWLVVGIILLCLTSLAFPLVLDDYRENITFSISLEDTGQLIYSEDMYSFYGHAGDVIMIGVDKTLGIGNPQYQVISPSGKIDDSQPQIYRLPESGTYSILISGAGPSAYRVRAVSSTRTPIPTPTQTPTQTPTPTRTLPPTLTVTPTPLTIESFSASGWNINQNCRNSSPCWRSQYFNNANNTLTSVSNYYIDPNWRQPVITFWHKYSTEPNYDYGVVELRVSGAQTWVSLAEYTGVSDWSFVQISLAGYRDKRISIRFRFYSDGSVITGTGWYVQDINILHTRTNTPFP